MCGWEDECEVDEVPLYWHPENRRWVRAFPNTPPTPQSPTPTEPEQGSPDTPDRWCIRGKQADGNRLARRKLLREGKPVPPELMPKKVDMKAIKKEMKILVDIAREAYLSAGGTPQEKRQRPA